MAAAGGSRANSRGETSTGRQAKTGHHQVPLPHRAQSHRADRSQSEWSSLRVWGLRHFQALKSPPSNENQSEPQSRPRYPNHRPGALSQRCSHKIAVACHPSHTCSGLKTTSTDSASLSTRLSLLETFQGLLPLKDLLQPPLSGQN